MKERQTLIEKFSTFAIVEERNGFLVVTRWVWEPKLQRYMDKMVAANPEATEKFWVLYWLKAALPLPPYPPAKWHLAAYLEEVCYWTSINICQEFSDKGYNPADCFQMARNLASNPAKLFANYDSGLSGVQTYAQMKLKSYMLEELRRGREVEKYSDWALLRSLTPTALQGALVNYGFKEAEIAAYRLAWQCFNEIYTPTTAEGNRRLQAPSAPQWETIAMRYNQLRGDLKLEAAVTVKNLQNLLNTVVKAVRCKSQNSPVSARSIEETDPSMPVPQSLLHNDSSEENNPKFEWEQVNSILSHSFQSLPEDIRKMLELWLGLDFNQQEVAGLFGWEQNKFSKQMKKHGKFLLKELLKELDKCEGNSKLSQKSKEIDQKGKVMQEWLKERCQADYVNFLNLRFAHMKKNQNGGNVSVSELQRQLRDELKSHVESRLQISLAPVPQADERLGAFVKEWGNFLK